MPDRIILLTIHHRHGEDHTACLSYEASDRVLDDYVNAWWGQELGEREKPASRSERIEEYFRFMRDQDGRAEFFQVEELEVVNA